jgi:hypothetical protein
MPQNLSPRTNQISGKRITTELYQKLGFQPKSSIGGRIEMLRGHDQAQRCTRQLSMIPTNKSEPKHLRIEATSHTQKSNENSSKKDKKITRATRRRSTQP